jgi:tetratricopeptide (TPR) repeat protein
VKKGALIAAVALGLTACGAVDRVAVRSTADVLVRGRASALDEPDYELARQALPAQIKLAEALLASAPNDRDLRRLAAEGFGGEAMLFVEDESPARAKGLYRRGRDHALAALALKSSFRGLADKTLDDFDKALAAAGKDDAPDLFWAGFNWAGEINLSKDDAAALAELPKAVALMSRLAELAPDYHFSGADLFFGVYYASRPPILGGDPKKAKAAFERALKATKGQYLMTSFFEARWYAVAVQDRALFSSLLKGVLSAPSGQLPEARLTDEAAKRKAAVLLEKIDDYF